jgi:hypothetical protein
MSDLDIPSLHLYRVPIIVLDQRPLSSPAHTRGAFTVVSFEHIALSFVTWVCGNVHVFYSAFPLYYHWIALLNHVYYRPFFSVVMRDVAAYKIVCSWDTVCAEKFVVCHLARRCVAHLRRASECHLQILTCETRTARIEPTGVLLRAILVM